VQVAEHPVATAEQLVWQLFPLQIVEHALAVRVLHALVELELGALVVEGVGFSVGPDGVGEGLLGAGVGMRSGPMRIGGSKGGKYRPGAGPTPKTRKAPTPPSQRKRQGKNNRATTAAPEASTVV
jgi:hypothetical protein